MDKEVAQLRAQRAKYADAALANVWAKLSAMAIYELEMYQHVATVSANYQQHLDWLSKRKRGVQYIRPPDIWLNFPDEPNLEPNNRQMVFGELAVNFLNSEDYKQFNNYVTNWLMEHIVTGRGAVPMTGSSFVEHVKQYPFYDTLLPEEKGKLFSELDDFISGHEELRVEQFNVTFTVEPPSAEIINLGRDRLPKTSQFKDKFIDFLRARGVKIDVMGLEQ
ncbi:hypothetical protein IB237_23535 [Agrobacterium sp. AGB01]|uniref:hypothetical protein n=1 Tax=Agrobacterium sp. AGB01 TaxID=2769302 RepID=UPI001780E355|nr:hypothetical protein [Agrobacterium sp. AGB01]MBD9390178.1 hypothetical protein [Agrobacterium sp. AGB01]